MTAHSLLLLRLGNHSGVLSGKLPASQSANRLVLCQLAGLIAMPFLIDKPRSHLDRLVAQLEP